MVGKQKALEAISRGLAPAIDDEDAYGTSGKDMAGRLIFDVPATITYD